jgi:hypothetical protein
VQPLIVPSFELVKYKYDPHPNLDSERGDNPHSFPYYLLPIAIYVVLTSLGFRMAFMPNVEALTNYFVFPIAVPANAVAADRAFLGALSYTFIGSYIWTIQYLIRRISNFDLAPISFFSRLDICWWPSSRWRRYGKVSSSQSWARRLSLSLRFR